MTNNMLAICPRKCESATIPLNDGEASLSINGTILAGTLMVKGEHEWHILQENSSLLDEILVQIGFAAGERNDVQDGNKL